MLSKVGYNLFMKIIRKMVFSTVFSKCTDGPKCATSQLKYWTISEKSFKINVGKIKRWKESWIFDSEKKNFYKESKCLECFCCELTKNWSKTTKGVVKKMPGASSIKYVAVNGFFKVRGQL